MIELIALWFIVSIVVGIVIGRSIHTMNIGDSPETPETHGAGAEFPFFPHDSALDTGRTR